ncbi:DUF2163 domain-containing protein [Phyllobacterium leguminum]|uniref:Putative phage protein (TIGR02218 family) n=1 Tax=Phyllobacterium leguminum TaxID=314237 RepID=A0A318SXZ8_9HYPH|nr:DUF2163 domain-containing protein [Phyllobacterium leguminum]PYE86922.1 putative phage protein (TIGR02218 family) [Phyllobacterium leguminum]
MKTLPPGLQAHLDSGATTLAWCWRIIRADGTTMGFTDHDRDLTFDGTVFAAATGFTTSEIESSLGLSVDNLEVEGALSSDAITEADISAGHYDGAAIEAWRVNWTDVAQRVLMRKGLIGEITRGKLAFRAELRGLSQVLDQRQGRSFQRTCDADLGDGRCKFNLNQAGFTGAGTVTAVARGRIITASGLGAFATGWFRHGLLTWASGESAGARMEVKAHKLSAGVATIELWHPMGAPVAVGDTFNVTAGCDKTLNTCKGRFSNAANFRGFPHMPGADKAFSYVVGESGENDGGSFFN